MRAWRVHQYGPHRDVLSLEDIPPPAPPPDGCVIEVAAAGLNFDFGPDSVKRLTDRVAKEMEKLPE